MTDSTKLSKSPTVVAAADRHALIVTAQDALEANWRENYRVQATAAVDAVLRNLQNLQIAPALDGMPTIWEDPAGKGYPCFERPMTPAEAKETIARYGEEVARFQEALTPSGDTKGAYFGEIKDPFAEIDEFGDEHTVNRVVSWDATKAIMKMIADRAAVPAPPVEER